MACDRAGQGIPSEVYWRMGGSRGGRKTWRGREGREEATCLAHGRRKEGGRGCHDDTACFYLIQTSGGLSLWDGILWGSAGSGRVPHGGILMLYNIATAAVGRKVLLALLRGDGDLLRMTRQLCMGDLPPGAEGQGAGAAA